MKLHPYILLLLGCITSFQQAQAQSNNFIMNVNTTLSAGCMVSLGNVNFSTMKPQATGEVIYVSSVRVLCTKNTPYIVNIGSGNGTFYDRYMKSEDGDDKLSYQLFTQFTGNYVAGDGTNGTYNFSGIGSGLTQTYNLNAKLPRNQFVSVGQYSDNISVIINY